MNAKTVPARPTATCSMTGYAAVQRPADPDATAPAMGVEVRAVNSRFLDLSLHMPNDWRTHEAALRARITSQVRRGKVEVRIYITGASSTTPNLPDVASLQQLSMLQDQVRAWLPQANPLSVADVLRLAESSGTRVQTPAAEALFALVDQALSELHAARASEGSKLAQALQERLAQLGQLAQAAQPLVPQAVEQLRQRFIQRWNDAVAATGSTPSDNALPERALAEATAYALRIDVSEELTRLSTHLDEISRLLTQGGEIGKRLDFLIQELHREANTLGSKSSTIDLTRIAMEMKLLIEQMREQVQNIE